MQVLQTFSFMGIRHGKSSNPFFILTHNYKFMLWYWGMVAIPVGIWYLWGFPSKKWFPEREIVEISPEFTGIKSKYMAFSVFRLLGVMVLPIVPLWPRLDNWAVLNYGIRFYPISVAFSTGIGIYQGLFAIISGAYPMAKSLSYVYDDVSRIRRAAIYQISISIAFIVVVVLFFFAAVG